MNQEQQMIDLAKHISAIEFEDNFAKITFDGTKTLADLEKSLKELGITEIFHKHTDMTGARSTDSVFVLEYYNSTQKKNIDALSHKYKRIDALKTLLYNGGTKLSDEESKFIDSENAKISALKMQAQSRNTK